jgi:hypothetical protein
MAIALSSPITGAAQTGFTSPTYTLTADNAPDFNGKQYAVTALGGTQASVVAHSVSCPFTISFFKPKVFRSLGKANPTTGIVKDVPRNTYKQIVRKGVLPLAGQSYQNMQITVTVDVPAGADSADPSNVRAAFSAAIGSLSQIASGFGDTAVSGILG